MHRVCVPPLPCLVRNPATVEYVISQSEFGPYGVDSPYVDGTFSDDVTGIPAEHGNAPKNIGLTSAQVAALQNSTNQYVQALIETLAAKGKYLWQAFGTQDGTSGGPSQGNCARYMAQVCDASFQNKPWLQQWDGKNTTIAAFLIGRGPVAYTGYGWNGGPLPGWDPLMDLNVGEPLSLCTQPTNGVFTRQWSAGTATLDCNTWTATLDFSY